MEHEQKSPNSKTSGIAEASHAPNGNMKNSEVEIPRLEDFHISEKTGFLLEQPLTELPAYFEAWNELGRQLPVLLTTHTLRDAVNQMPLLDHRQLSGHRQWRLAYTILSFIGNGYVWQDGEAGVVKRVPRQLAIPWYGVSTYLGLKPGICQANAVLNNWQAIDPNRPLTIDNMKVIFELPGGINCQWFFLISAEIEKDVAPGLKAILKAKESITRSDTEGLREALDSLADNIRHVKTIVQRIHENLNADVFYDVIRPYLSGWGDNSAVLPDGVIFEGVSDVPLAVTGNSAAQSSSIQCYDAALGVVHDSDKQQFLDKMKTYMPPAHAQFIAALKRAPSIRDFVLECQDDAVKDAYKRCVAALSDFRSYHIQVTTKYVVSKSKGARGTGGTELTPFLKSIRSSTSAAASFN